MPSSKTRGFTSVHKELNTSLGQDTLLHGETLLVAATHDLKHIPLELISELVTADLLSQSLVVELAAEPQKEEINTQTARKRNKRKMLRKNQEQNAIAGAKWRKP